jgi:hypothetical protein
MRLVHITLLLLALAATGCATKELKEESQHERHMQALKRYRNYPVPLPAATPFDSEPTARKTYLAAYRKGYRNGLTGIMVDCFLTLGQPNPPQERGWSDGQLAGFRASLSQGEKR